MRILANPHFKTVAAYGMAVMLTLIPIGVIAAGPAGGSSAGSGSGQLKLADPLVIPGNSGSTVTINTLIPALINALIQIGLVVIVLAFMWAGFKYVTAFGDETKIKDAHKIFKYTVIGAAVLLGARALSEILRGTVEAIRTTT